MKARVTLAALFALLYTCASGQNSHVAYYMNIPQSHFLNPAFKPSSSIYVGLPALSGMNFNLANNFFNFSDVFPKGTPVSSDNLPFLSPGFNISHFLGRVKTRNFIETNTTVQLLGFGIAIGPNNYFFLDVNDRVSTNVVLPGSLIRLAFLGIQQYAGQTLDLSDLRMDARYFHEVGLGFSRDVIPNLRVGAKAKLLFGVASLSGKSTRMDLTVNNDLSATLQSDMVLHNNGAIEFTFDNEGRINDGKPLIGNLSGHDIGRYMGGSGNFGLGLDLGADYSINSMFRVSASITDLGFINWKADARTPDIRTKSTIEFHGYDFTDIYGGSINIDSLMSTLGDTLSNGLIRDNPGRFRTSLPATFTVGGLFNLNKMVSFGVVSSSRFVNRQLREALALSGNVHLGKIFDASLTYTFENRSYNNLGAGFAVRGGFTQFYFMVDRIPLRWAKADFDNNSHISMPANWNTINTWFGINLVFGYRGERKHVEESDGEK
jgi:hypothetical protein